MEGEELQNVEQSREANDGGEVLSRLFDISGADPLPNQRATCLLEAIGHLEHQQANIHQDRLRGLLSQPEVAGENDHVLEASPIEQYYANVWEADLKIGAQIGVDSGVENGDRLALFQ